MVEKEKDIVSGEPDIVDRLRNPLKCPPRMTLEVFSEAADEIERLRRLLDDQDLPHRAPGQCRTA